MMNVQFGARVTNTLRQQHVRKQAEKVFGDSSDVQAPVYEVTSYEDMLGDLLSFSEEALNHQAPGVHKAYVMLNADFKPSNATDRGFSEFLGAKLNYHGKQLDTSQAVYKVMLDSTAVDLAKLPVQLLVKSPSGASIEGSQEWRDLRNKTLDVLKQSSLAENPHLYAPGSVEELSENMLQFISHVSNKPDIEDYGAYFVFKGDASLLKPELENIKSLSEEVGMRANLAVVSNGVDAVVFRVYFGPKEKPTLLN